MFLYWGRRGGGARLALQVCREALAEPSLKTTVSVSCQSELVDEFRSLGAPLFPVDTFASNVGPLAHAWRLPILRRQLVDRLRLDGTQAVVTLMPHVWTPFMAPAIRKAGVLYLPVIHDADPHPGDPTAFVHTWILRDLDNADCVLTLSKAVAERLTDGGRVERERLLPLFHPDLVLGPTLRPARPQPGKPFRLMFFGRIARYKGLGLLLDAIDLLRKQDVPIHLGVFGDGPLGPYAERLQAIGAEVVNRWLRDEEIGQMIPNYHAVAVTHTEASQSGVAAAALGSGLPVIANPVGGLTEQVEDGVTGILARGVSAAAFAEAIKRLALNAALFETICTQIERTREARSTRRFVASLVRHLNTLLPVTST